MNSSYTNKSNKSNSKFTPIYAGGKVVGKVYGDTFYKSIAKNHYLQKPPGIAFSDDSLKQAEKAGAKWVEVKDRDNGVKRRASLERIRKHGFPVRRPGFEPQTGLALEMWDKTNKDGPTQKTLF